MERGGEHLGRKMVVCNVSVYLSSCIRSEWARGRRALNNPNCRNNTEKSGFGVGLKAPVGKNSRSTGYLPIYIKKQKPLEYSIWTRDSSIEGRYNILIHKQMSGTLVDS